jgi:hypothetical protein
MSAAERSNYPLPHDNNNFAPRVAVAYDLRGDGRTSLHGSYGMFFENTYTTVASVTQIVTGAADGVRTLVLAAPRASVAWGAPGRKLTEAQVTAILGGPYPSTEISLDPNMKTGFTHQTSLGRQPVARFGRVRQRQRRLRARIQSARDDRLQPGAAGNARTVAPPERPAMFR